MLSWWKFSIPHSSINAASTAIAVAIAGFSAPQVISVLVQKHTIFFTGVGSATAARMMRDVARIATTCGSPHY
jgi:hypothetical protein